MQFNDHPGRSLVGQTPYTKTLRQLELFFSKAMFEGYASGNSSKIAPHRNIGGWSQYDYSDGKFLLTDEWGENTGRTWISVYQGTGEVAAPIWVMHYEGHYQKEVISFLKWALAVQYAKYMFNGGRGPSRITGSGSTTHLLEYRNKVTGCFRQFTAQEEIYCKQADKLVGNHSCWGGMLI